VKRVAVIVASSCAAMAAGVSPAHATDECQGLMVCVPIAGPWVVVPARLTVPRRRVEFQLSCPRNYVVGGLDAELSEPAIDLAFLGTLGSPVNPGISTARAVVFVATYVGARPGRTPSFRPHIGCIPASGGGGRVLTSVDVVQPGKPAVRRAFTLRARPGAHSFVRRCGNGERLTAASTAVGFYRDDPPGARLARSVIVRRSVHAGAVSVSVRAGPAVGRARAIVQLDLVCAGGE
jgi:hypothetical protein